MKQLSTVKKENKTPYLKPDYKPKTWVQKYKWEVILSLFGLFAIHIFLFNEAYSGENLNAEKASLFGGFIGGYIGTLFGLLSVVLIFLTFKTQRQSSEIEKFENHFFELIHLHRENVKEITSYGQEGKKMFVTLIREYRKIQSFVKVIFSEEELIDQINISYLTLYYGNGPNSGRQLKKALSKYKKGKVEQLINHLDIEYKKFNKKEKNKLKGNTNHKKSFEFYGGHQSRLGHYYRHLFQAITFCHTKELDIDKYAYIKLIRAQLTNHEQALLSLNSISDLGMPWNKNKDTNGEGLIHVYRLIKNIPEDFFDPETEFDIKALFPKMVFEHEEKRINLDS